MKSNSNRKKKKRRQQWEFTHVRVAAIEMVIYQKTVTKHSKILTQKQNLK